MMIKAFEEWLNEEVDSTLGAGGTSWSKPVAATVTKNKEKGGNVIKVKNTPNGPEYNYEIIGSALGKKYDINFNWLKKTDKAGMIIARTVSGGVDPYEVDFATLSTLLPKLAKGQGDSIGGWAGSVEFKKI
jgi:hypothetical protein